MTLNNNEIKANDEKYVWHAFRRANVPSTIIKSAEGSWITDLDGNRYLDGMSGLWSVNVGYGRKELAQAAYDQLMDVPYFPLSQSHLPAIQLAEKLNEWLGDEYVVFFSNSGSEANETAFKIARQYQDQIGEHNRYKFISRYRAYHGNSMGALAATGQAQRKYKYEPLGGGFLHVTPPDSYRHTEEENMKFADEIDHVITWELEETVAAVIMEPIITGGGILMPPEGYLQRVREICDKHGVLLIIDEVICGFGRTGAKMGFMNYGIKPDIITMAKGLTSSYQPLSATAVRKEIFEAFKGSAEYDHLRHVNTFGGHPAACAVALKNLEIIESEGLVENSRVLGEKFLQEFEELKSHPNVGDVRGKGLLLGIEVVTDKATKEPASNELLAKLIGACKAEGLIIGKNGDTVAGFNNILQLSPPLNLTQEDFEFIVTTVKKAFASI